MHLSTTTHFSHAHTIHTQLFLAVPLLTALSDLIYTVVLGSSKTVAQFQYISPIVIIVAMVNLLSGAWYYSCIRNDLLVFELQEYSIHT